MRPVDPVDDVRDGQAEVQTALGLMKLGGKGEHTARLEKALAHFHRALWFMDAPMYRPTRHPDVPNPQSDDHL